MREEPPSGRVVIEWWRIADGPPEGSEDLEFDWKVTPEPPGLTDDEISRLLGEISKRF